MKNLRPEIVFLWLALLFGGGFLVLTPPFQVPDEAFHLFRSWEISVGRLEEESAVGQTQKEVPKSLVQFLSPFLKILYNPNAKASGEEILNFRHWTLEAEDTQRYAFVSTAPHPAFPYLPQAAAMLAGRTLNLSPFSLFYLGRTVNFLIWLALVFAALRILPLYRWVFLVLALSPMSLHQAASLSPDALSNALAFLFIAAILRLALLESPLEPVRGLAGATLASLFLVVSKAVYLGHAMLFLLLPRRKFSSTTKYILCLAVIFAVHAAAIALLLHGENFGARPEAQAQSQWVLHHPLEYVELLMKTFRFQSWRYLRQYVGVFGHLDTPLPQVLTVFYLSFLGFVAALDRGTVRSFAGKEKVLLVSVALLEILAILTTIFITWTRPGSSVVLGIQGRYFIPVIPLLLLPFYRRKTAEGFENWLAPLCLYAMTMVLTVSLFTLKARFY